MTSLGQPHRGKANSPQRHRGTEDMQEEAGKKTLGAGI
jgi:hypothetical protein